MQEENVAPGIDLLESMRSVGYSLEAAIADLIDNSIAAGSRRIDVDLEPASADYVAILDDGTGIAPDAAVEALRLAGSVGERSITDLGRFGLGLKTASLSQARCLTVITKYRGETTALRWDIDHIKAMGRWSLLRLSLAEVRELPWASRLDLQESGTLVLWQHLDLLVGDAVDPGELVRQRVEPLIESLALVFHRYLHGRKDGIQIVVNGNVVKPLDPFLTSNSKTQASPTQRIAIGGDEVKVTAYTLPHVSGLTPDERQRPDLGEHMREKQGFYIYRNERLISHGHWYGLARMDDLSKQTRVQVDVPNTIDHLWHLDIKKSRAEPPSSFKTELRRLMSGVIEKGRRVYTYRGRKEADFTTVHLWEKIRERDGFRYEVNLENPLISTLLSGLPTADASRVVRLLQSLADTFPVHDLFAEMAGNVPLISAERAEDATNESLRLFRDSTDTRLPVEDVIAMLMHVEPFSTMSDLDDLVRKVWQEDLDGND
nr:ATP-binding protein [Microbacterium bovistercoris]